MSDTTITLTTEEVAVLLSLLAKVNAARSEQTEPRDADVIRRFSRMAHEADPVLCENGRVWVNSPDGRAGMAPCSVCGPVLA